MNLSPVLELFIYCLLYPTTLGNPSESLNDAMKSFGPCSQPSQLKVLTFPHSFLGGCSDDFDDFRFFFEHPIDFLHYIDGKPRWPSWDSKASDLEVISNHFPKSWYTVTTVVPTELANNSSKMLHTVYFYEHS